MKQRCSCFVRHSGLIFDFCQCQFSIRVRASPSCVFKVFKIGDPKACGGVPFLMFVFVAKLKGRCDADM